MKRILVFLAGAMLLGACGADSDLPEASGKATLRSINAVPTSGEVTFRIEELIIGAAPYQGKTASVEYDDLDYTFNFDVFYAGETGLQRVARQFLDVVANKDYTFLLTGSLASPTITVLEDDRRVFDASEDVFAAKFMHVAESMGALDYYFADAATVPVAGAEVATLSSGELSVRADFVPGQYVLTLTTAGNPADVVYVSEETTFAAQNSFFITLFDGDANNTSPLVVQALPETGFAVPMPDPSYGPVAEFINLSLDLGESDIYHDEALTSLLVADLDFLDVSAEVDVAAGANDFYYTPSGDTSAVTLQGSLAANNGTRYRYYANGVAGNFITDFVLPDRKPLETMVKLTAYHGSTNFGFLDLYVIDADTSIDDQFAARPAIGFGSETQIVPLTAGSYDIYVTEFNSKEVLAGPYRIDVVLGDIVDTVIVDTVDPAVVDILFLSGGPSP